MTQLEQNEIVLEVLTATGLNWEVKPMPLHTPEGDRIEDSRYMGYVRSDNGALLGISGEKYHPMQNYESAHLLMKAAGSDFNPDAEFKHPWDNTGEDGSLGSYGNIGGGCLKGGRRIFLQIELPEMYIGKSDIKRYITIANQHDGTAAFAFGNGNQVVCCENTFMMARKYLMRFRHGASMQQRVDAAAASYMKTLEFERIEMENFNRLAEIPIAAKSQIDDVIHAALNVKKPNDVSTKTQNKIDKMLKAMNISIDEQGENLYALLNGVTRYTNHMEERKNKVLSLESGTDFKINNRGYQAVLTEAEIV